jgi:hypothetical protein
VRFQLWHLPVRVATGAFILNSGLGKLKTNDDDTLKGVHGMASSAYPPLSRMDPKTFVRALGAGEVALGAALLSPFVSPAVAGGGLTAFSGGLLGLYFKIPGMTVDGIRPSPQGLAIAKDSWLLAIGAALMLDRASKKVRETVPGLTP